MSDAVNNPEDLRQLLASTSDAMIWLADGHVRLASAQAQTILGEPLEGLPAAEVRTRCAALSDAYDLRVEGHEDKRELWFLESWAARHARETFRSLVEGSVQGVVIHRDFRVLFANEAWAQICGYEHPSQMVGRDILDDVPKDRHASFWEGYRLVIDGRDKGKRLESELRRRDGTRLWVERIHTRVLWRGEPALLATCADITERKHTQQELRAAVKRLDDLQLRLRADNQYLKVETGRARRELIGTGKAFRAMMDIVERVAPTGASVLLLGASGTGKSAVADEIHRQSRRVNKPFVKLNCAALPDALIESELFGRERGAYTGADRSAPGRLELADGGTLFLDEIAELSLEAQPKLLRALQEGEFERVGGTETKRVDVRIIAATNRDLAASVKNGTFREDLFYRLNVVPIRCPSLRERAGDIPALADHFVRAHSARLGRAPSEIAPSSMKLLIAYDWPGNIRELENVIERSLILSSGPLVELHDALEGPQRTPQRNLKDARTLPEMERQMIEEALQATSGVIEGPRGAAKRLDIAPSTLRERIRRWGIQRANTT